MGHSFQRWSRMTATTETICTSILNLPRLLASIANPSEAAIERNPLTRNSRPIIITAIHAGTMLGLNCTRVTNAAAIRSLSANGSSKTPMVVICPRLRARYPSMPSVIDAAINRAEASSSFSPPVLSKRLVERIQISSGILQMRVSVMELGRFTGPLGDRMPGTNARTSDTRIILHHEQRKQCRNRAKGQTTKKLLPRSRRPPFPSCYKSLSGVSLGFRHRLQHIHPGREQAALRRHLAVGGESIHNHR